MDIDVRSDPNEHQHHYTDSDGVTVVYSHIHKCTAVKHRDHFSRQPRGDLPGAEDPDVDPGSEHDPAADPHALANTRPCPIHQTWSEAKQKCHDPHGWPGDW